MKPFSFSLEAVLVMRTREEQAAMEAWALAVQGQAQAEQALAVAKRKLESEQNALCQMRRECFLPGDQVVFINAVEGMKSVLDRLASELKKAADVARVRHADLMQARMKREVLARLKQKKMNQYQSTVRAAEELAIDDIVIAQYARREGDL